MASNSYQTVIAGRVREDEGIGYFGQNKVTTPAGNFSVARTGGSVKEPKIVADFLNTENVGKNTNRDVPVLDTNKQGSNNVA
jgi:hypothetical protein